MDYYWMMGDNRNNSQDARMWGFVPFNHVVGKPVMVWLSYDSKLSKFRWDRMFTTVKGEGKATSFLWLAVLIIVGLFGWDFYRRRKRKSKA
ncbi:MAG: signal peptidase I [Candidatus Latescibacterota bacterium]|jgi:signal peptidase I